MGGAGCVVYPSFVYCVRIRHVAAFLFDRHYTFEMALEGLDRELQTRELAWHANRRRVPIQRYQELLLNILEHLVLHARRRNS